MKITKEVKIGVSSIIILFVLYWGISFLKGANVFKSTNIYTTSYSDVQGLEASSPVIINGMKVGTVIGISMENISEDVVVEFTVARQYKLPSNTVAVLGSQSLMGGMQLTLNIGDSKEMLADGDVVLSGIDSGMADAVSVMAERASSLVDSLTITLGKVNSLMSQNMIDDTHGALSNMNKSTENLNKMLVSESGKIAEITSNLSSLSSELKTMLPDMKSAMANVNSLTDSLNQSLPEMMAEIQMLVNKINSNDGTVGKILNDKELYENAALTMEEAAALLKDLKENPSRYVHFSLFGKKEK